MREYRCNLLGMCLPRIGTKQLEETLRRKVDTGEGTKRVLVKLLLGKIRSGGMDEEDEEEMMVVEDGRREGQICLGQSEGDS